MNNLYEVDFSQWIDQQVNLLKSKEYEHIDLENIIEEIESMGKSDRRSLIKQFVRLVMHLLKFKYQPEKQETGSSWAKSIRDARTEIHGILRDSPSLRNYLEINSQGLYLKAVREASEETGLPISLFERKSLWSLDEVLGDE